MAADREIEYGYCHIEDRIEVPRNWLSSWPTMSSPVWFLGVHMYDQVRWLVQDEFRLVSATGSKKKLAGLGVDTYDPVQAKLVLKNGSSFTVDSSRILPQTFEAVVNQGIRIVGSEGMMEIDTQDRGARACAFSLSGGTAGSAPAMQTPNLGFFFEERDKPGFARYGGYGVTSIQDFGENVNRLLEGASPSELTGPFAPARMGSRSPGSPWRSSKASRQEGRSFTWTIPYESLNDARELRRPAVASIFQSG